jgi:hypothetical protein
MDNPLKAAIFKAKVEPAPRVFETNKKEIGSAKPGQDIELCLYGKVQSIHDDGRIYVKVSSVELDTPETEAKMEPKEKQIYSKTQGSKVS